MINVIIRDTHRLDLGSNKRLCECCVQSAVDRGEAILLVVFDEGAERRVDLVGHVTTA